MTEREAIAELLEVSGNLYRLHQKSALGGCAPFEVGAAMERYDELVERLQACGLTRPCARSETSPAGLG